MRVTCDKFYILSNVKVIRSEVRVTEVMAGTGAYVTLTHLVMQMFCSVTSGQVSSVGDYFNLFSGLSSIFSFVPSISRSFAIFIVL